MSDIFISYARPTAAQARIVAANLRALGYSVWLDDELPPHRAYARVLQEQLTAAKAVVVIWSANAIASDWVASEANRAREARKLVQLTIDASRLPMPFDQIQCADLSGWHGDVDAPGWRKVIGSIAELVDGTPPTLMDVASHAAKGKVVQWTAGYIAAAFGALQGIALLGSLFGWPEWVGRAAAILLGWGIPVAIIVAWFHGTPGRQRVPAREATMILVFAALAAANVGWVLWRLPSVELAAHSGTRVPSTTAPVIAPNTIAVLPFENLGGREQDAYLSEGISDELRDQLSRVNGLRVLARSSSVVFGGRKKSAADVAAALGAATIVEGSLRKDGQHLHISVRLIDAVKGVQLWSESYDRAASDLFAVQQKIALAAAQQILPQLSATDVPAPQWKASVHELMLLARSYQQNATRPGDQDRVVELYQRVLSTDPLSAPAHARLAKALLLQGQNVAAAEQHAQRALSLDPNLAEGHAVLGLLLWSQYKHGSGAAFKRAIDLNPNDAEAAYYYAHYLAIHSGTGATHMRRARDLDPMSLVYNGDLGWMLAEEGHLAEAADVSKVIAQRFPDVAGRLALERIADAAGDLDEAVAWALEARQLDAARADVTVDLAELYARLGMPEASRRIQPQPSLRTLFWERRYRDIVTQMSRQDLDEADADAMGYLAFALQAQGRDAEAIPVLRSMGLPEIAVDDDLRRWAGVNHLMTLIGALHATGDDPQARRLAQWLEGWMAMRAQDVSAGAYTWRACAKAELGNPEQAMAALEASATARTLAWMPYLMDAGCFRSLRNDPRYGKTIASVQARYDALRNRLPLTLAKHGLPAARI